MIEKNSEIMPDFSANSEVASDENDFLKKMKLKNKNKEISHGEDNYYPIFNNYRDLYSKKKPTMGEVTSAVLRNQIPVSIMVIMPVERGIEAIVIAKSSIKPSKVNDISTNEILHSVTTSVSAHRTGEVSALLDDFTHSDERHSKEQTQESTKAHPTVAMHLKQDVLAPREEQQLQEMKRSVQLSLAERMFQTNTNTGGGETRRQKQSLSIDYPFLRWSGTHSVKVSIPVDIQRAGNLTLLPSDTRAAEVLTRQASQLNGFTAVLLQPQHPEDDESGRRHSQHPSEEEQE